MNLSNIFWILKKNNFSSIKYANTGNKNIKYCTLEMVPES